MQVCTYAGMHAHHEDDRAKAQTQGRRVCALIVLPGRAPNAG